MKQYIISIIAAAIIGAVVKSMLPEKGSVGRIAGLLCRILTVVTILAPLSDIQFSRIPNYLENISGDAGVYVEEGKLAAEKQTADIIKDQMEAYILDKANRMDLEISVEVELDDDNGNIPCSVVVVGSCSPYAKEVLGTYIEDNLGISKENQKWM